MKPASIQRHLLSILLLAVLLVGVAAPAAAAPVQAPSESPAGAADTVRHAFDLLMDRFVRPLDSATLLQAGFLGAEAAAGVTDQPAPTLSGVRDADWNAFAATFQALQARAGVDGTAATQGAIAAMASAAHEGHTFYLNPQAYQDYLHWMQGDVHYSGIGTRIDRDTLVILEVFENSSAAQAGMQAGDTVIAVDGQTMEGSAAGKVIDLIRGQAGTPVTISVRRSGVELPLDFTVTRGEVQVPFVKSSMLDGDVGYIRLRGFADAKVADDFEAALNGVQDQGARSLVIDLRGNSGGRVDVGSRILSLFIQSGPLYHQIDRSGQAFVPVADGHYRAPPLPLAILVDGGTASMAEIFAAAIQDHQRGTVIGTRTAGSVAAAQVYGLPDGSALQVTVLEITSANERPLNDVGVQPDQVLDADLAALREGHDVQLDAAVATVRAPAQVPAAWLFPQLQRLAA